MAALWSVLGERDLRPRERLPWVALAAMLVPTYVSHARQLDLGDSIHYYTYLRSLLFDHDLDLANDYTLRFRHQLYQIARDQVRPGLRGANVRIEARLDGSIAVRFQNRWQRSTSRGLTWEASL